MNTQTLEQMKQLRLHGMLRAFNTSLSSQSIDYANDELIAYLIQSEWDDRHNRKIERLTRSARFRYSALMENIDYDPSRKINKNQIQRFASCDFVAQNDHILITGSTGAGKSYMASAIRPVPWGTRYCTSILINYLRCSKHQKQMALMPSK